LLPVVGVTMADRALAACEALPVGRKIANAHHLPEQILAWAEARYLDHVQIEPVLLDTGAALARRKYEDEILSGHVLVHNGDLITLDVQGRRLHLHVDDAELERRRAAWRAPPPAMASGYWKLYIDHVLQADEGADLDFLRGARGAAVPKDNH
jgi:hypothetical protein